MAAQDGTTAGLASGLGLGEGVGVPAGDSLGLGEGDTSADADGLWCEATPFEFEQPTTANIAMTAASLSPTRK